MCECDRDCNIENHFCAEGLTCSKDGVCRGKKGCKNCFGVISPPHALAVLGIIAVVVTLVCFYAYVSAGGLAHTCSKHKALEKETMLLASLYYRQYHKRIRNLWYGC